MDVATASLYTETMQKLLQMPPKLQEEKLPSPCKNIGFLHCLAFPQYRHHNGHASAKSNENSFR